MAPSGIWEGFKSFAVGFQGDLEGFLEVSRLFLGFRMGCWRFSEGFQGCGLVRRGFPTQVRHFQLVGPDGYNSGFRTVAKAATVG